MKKLIHPAASFRGRVKVAADKSISHRAVMVASISEGESVFANILLSEDCMRTIEAFRAMGVAIAIERNRCSVRGKGIAGLMAPRAPLYLGNSGTTMRLILGILVGQEFSAELTGDASLERRPMKRVTEPLRRMGASITGKKEAGYAPLKTTGGPLSPIDYISPIASAQVKSAILFAGLYAEGWTSVTEPYKSRDHTERMLSAFAAEVRVEGLRVAVRGRPHMHSADLEIPGDISSAAFFIVGALLHKDSLLVIDEVGLNPSRTGILDILKRMGGKINESVLSSEWEPKGKIEVASSSLEGVTVEKEEIPRCIDELPLLMVAASLARGRTVIKGAGELRVKETDRISSMVHNLSAMGADIKCVGEDIIINGRKSLKRASLDSFSDHRTAMACAIAAGLAENGPSSITGSECVDISFPAFFEILESVSYNI